MVCAAPLPGMKPTRRAMTIDEEMNRNWDTLIAAYERAYPKMTY